MKMVGLLAAYALLIGVCILGAHATGLGWEGARVAVAAGFGLAFPPMLVFDVTSSRPQEPGARVVVACLAFLCALPLTGTSPASGFYDTAAQIIPVLLLTLLVEQRTSILDAETPDDRTLRSLVLLMLLLGEAGALLAAGSEKLGHLALGVVAGALAAGLIGVVEIALVRPRSTGAERPPA